MKTLPGMKKEKVIKRLFTGVFGVVGLIGAQALAGGFASVRIAPAELNWRGLDSGVQYAPISGQERTSDMYVYRVAFPKGHKSEPHYHTDQRVITILQGSLYVGYGDVYDETKLKKLPEGSVFTEPKDTPHFVWAKDEKVLMQVTGTGKSRRVLSQQPVRKSLVIQDVTIKPNR